MQNHNELKDRLKGYKIDGDIVELWNVITTNALVLTTFNDIVSALSESKPNYIRLGYGETLFKAYENGYVKGESCKLVHICFRNCGMNLRELLNFIESFGGNIIFGYSYDETIKSEVKLVMIFN